MAHKVCLAVIAPTGCPHLVKFYFDSTRRPERRAYIVVGNDVVYIVVTVVLVVKGAGIFLLYWGSKAVLSTVVS